MTTEPDKALSVRYVDGRLDLGHAPSLATLIGKSLASYVSRNNMPCISGDDRERIPDHVRSRYDASCLKLAEEILKPDLSRKLETATALLRRINMAHDLPEEADIIAFLDAVRT